MEQYPVGLQFAKIPQQGGGWFKPAEHNDAVAILVEVIDFERQRPTGNGPKDSALVDLTIFSQESLDGQGDPTIIKGTRIEQTVLARDLAGLKGQATIATVIQIPSKKAGQHPAWVWRTVSGDVESKVMSWAEQREKAVLDAIDSAPDFS